jgi:phenylalanyl-tRNA synthetase beta chain
MRVPLSWLRDYIEVDLEPERLAERLTMLGMEVKGIERRGTAWTNVVVGELLAVERHPRADRLSLTRVTVGSGEPLEIVCGATNIAVGQRVPVALPGAVLPGDRRIERTEKMGVVSNGMLCSGDELELTSDADGILILPADTPLGTPLADLYGDVVLDIDVKPNRGDALSILGLAREISIVTGAPVRPPVIELLEDTADPTSRRLAVTVMEPDLCPRFVGRWLSDVRIGPSPRTVQSRLLAAGMRPVSNVVDASNYVMLELGKPIHTFDAAAVARDGDGQARIVVRRAAAGEPLETLDHVVRTLDPDALIIADSDGPLGIAGVMGSVSSEISDATTAVIVESAIFDPISIRRTGQRYGLRSEASLRFEKGQETRLARIGADRCAQLILDWAGGTLGVGRVDSAPAEPVEQSVAFRPERVSRLLGLELDPDAQRRVLARAGIQSAGAVGPTTVAIAGGSDPMSVEAPADDVLVATIPTWRRDLVIEGDIAEEIARIHGYESIPPTVPDTTPPRWTPSPLELRDGVRDALVGAGVTEIVTHALVSPGHLEAFAWTSTADPADGELPAGGRPIYILNPLAPDHSVMRQGLLASLADVVSTNARNGRTDLALFEIGKGYGRDDEGASEWWRLAIGLTGDREPAAWNRSARAADLDDVKGLVELLAARTGLGRPLWTPLAGEPVLHPGRSASVEARTGDGLLGLSGRVGELHPSLVERWDLRVDRLIVAELSIAGLTSGQLPVVKVAPIVRQPAVERDLAVVVAEDVSAGAVEASIRAAAGPLLVDVYLFDVYRGTPLASGEKSLAERLVFQARDRTLTDVEIDSELGTITAALVSRTGARLRT